MKNLIQLVRKTPNRGKMHIFLGSPLSDGCDKTTVEPGNTYSPGVWTCGVSIWIESEGSFFTPDLLVDKKIKWKFIPPVVESQYIVGDSIRVIHRLCHLGTEGSRGVDFNVVEIRSESDSEISLYIVVKDVGPAGGVIRALEWDESKQTLHVNKGIKLVVEQPVNECRIILHEGSDDSPLALLHYQINLKANLPHRISFKTEHDFSDRPFAHSISPVYSYTGISIEEGFRKCYVEWEQILSVRVFAPDKRIPITWERCAYHILAAMECGLPRIGAVNYPILWIRDGVIVLRALDLIGRHDLARKGNNYLAPLYFSGGFGAESDVPGEGIWALVSHARITGDDKWLKHVFPHICKRVEWLEKMLEAKVPLRMLSENREPLYLNTPGVNILCLPSKNGLIHGRMDWHSPDFFINCWASCGFHEAALAAMQLGRKNLAERWFEKSKKLDRAITTHLLPQYGNDRDPIVTPYPTKALNEYLDVLRNKFRDWYRANRLTADGKRKAEVLWTYFEAAQIHNAILLDMKKKAWINLNGMLDFSGVSAWDVTAYTEGQAHGAENMPFRSDIGCRGWLNRKTALGGNMPHNWTSAEMVNLIRDIFVVEEGDTLILGKGVPPEWSKPGSRFGVTNMPTDFGPVTYTVIVDRSGKVFLNYKGSENYRTAFIFHEKEEEVIRHNCE